MQDVQLSIESTTGRKTKERNVPHQHLAAAEPQGKPADLLLLLHRIVS